MGTHGDENTPKPVIGGEPMSRLRTHAEGHFVNRIGWLRAAVLGANDGIISTAS